MIINIIGPWIVEVTFGSVPNIKTAVAKLSSVAKITNFQDDKFISFVTVEGNFLKIIILISNSS